MELPAHLRQAIERELEGVPLAELRRAGEVLSHRYRSETRDGRLHLADDVAVKAYLATRLPATYAAIRASLDAVCEVLPDFRPRSLLDVGAGPGSALWAAADCWAGIERAVLIEASAAVRRAGEQLASDAPIPPATWVAADVTADLPGVGQADLVTVAYVLDELQPHAVTTLIERTWSRASGVLLVVEPSTPAGWRRILDVRAQLVTQGAHLAAPCPHEAPCPLTAPDWCHFARRVARSRLHRLAKSADVPWEDEKFIYLAATRAAIRTSGARVLAPPRSATGRVTLKLCNANGTASESGLSKRDGSAYREARRAAWGDTLSAAEDRV
jgi:ribosomal protein RSM22 (predicted rRNA methylase)